MLIEIEHRRHGLSGFSQIAGTLAIANAMRDVIFLYVTQSRGNKTRRKIRDMFHKFDW